jgi:hypothetical protein
MRPTVHPIALAGLGDEREFISFVIAVLVTAIHAVISPTKRSRSIGAVREGSSLTAWMVGTARPGRKN